MPSRNACVPDAPMHRPATRRPGSCPRVPSPAHQRATAPAHYWRPPPRRGSATPTPCRGASSSCPVGAEVSKHARAESTGRKGAPRLPQSGNSCATVSCDRAAACLLRPVTSGAPALARARPISGPASRRWKTEASSLDNGPLMCWMGTDDARTSTRAEAQPAHPAQGAFLGSAFPYRMTSAQPKSRRPPTISLHRKPLLFLLL